ncbi:MBL fold metallo-hydrolase [Nostoc sp.]|uniref:MBL fold metallo-hydrolase n=1 Tax=Nostoc sp. TaxID=1180 RepID=UPI002FF7AECD
MISQASKLDKSIENQSSAIESIPDAARGPAIPPDKGYLVEEICDHLYWIGDGIWNTMFLTYNEGVIVVDAPASIGQNYRNAIQEVTDKPVTYVIYSHSHADHTAAASMFSETATYIAHEETRAILARRQDPRRPVPTVTFSNTYTLQAGEQTLILDYKGPNHEPGNIFIYAPRQKVLLLKDIIYPGWIPFKGLGGIVYDVPGYIEAHDHALSYNFNIFIGGHVNRLGVREDVVVSREFILDLKAAALQARQQVNFSEVSQGVRSEDRWMHFEIYFNAIIENCTNIMMPKWKSRLGGAEAFMHHNCWAMMRSLVLDFPPESHDQA